MYYNYTWLDQVNFLLFSGVSGPSSFHCFVNLAGEGLSLCCRIFSKTTSSFFCWWPLFPLAPNMNLGLARDSKADTVWVQLFIQLLGSNPSSTPLPDFSEPSCLTCTTGMSIQISPWFSRLKMLILVSFTLVSQ